MDDRREGPATEAGRTLLRQWKGHPNEIEVRVVVLAIEHQARVIERTASVTEPIHNHGGGEHCFASRCPAASTELDR